MRIMVASDIHGSVYYCRKLLNAFSKEKPDKLLLLGDILYHGPRNDLPRDYAPKDIIPLLNARKSNILCVRGNCDTEVDQMVLEFPIMADYCILYMNGRMIFATHGHRFNKKFLPSLQPEDILLYGHTHIPACEETKGILCINPGSVSIPKNNSYHGYMILSEPEFLWKDLDGAIQQRYSFGTNSKIVERDGENGQIYR